MTAIYAVWNNYGFALASDSNQTANQTDQTWVDPVDKVVLLEKHQVAVAAAGSAMHENIEINEIIRSWENQLPEKGFSNLDDYFVDFSIWFAKQTFNFDEFDIERLVDFARKQFEIFREHYSAHVENNDIQTFLEEFLSIVNLSRNSLNIYASAWEDFGDETELITEVSSDTTTEKLLCVDRLHQKLINDSRFLQNIDALETFQRISHHPNYDSEIFPRLVNEFQSVFERNFDIESEIDQTMIYVVLAVLENCMDFDPNVKILMVGYGKDDWLPTGISFEVADSYCRVPRIKVSDYSNPNFNWYVALAVDSAVWQLTRGHSRQRHREINEMATQFLKEEHENDFYAGMREIADKQFRESVRRLDFLTLERLEFVSRLFVQIEALKSYLDEPVQGVGGDTKVISMTKTTKKVRIFKELG
jgi:hypothetical protein